MVPAPQVDERTAREIYAEVCALLPVSHLPEHGGFDSALIHIFARFSELVIYRLNQAPQKNFMAFLDLLGVSPLPMQAATVPLTFSPAPGTAGCALVPKGTQVAAPPGPGEQKPVIFETDRELIVTPARLDSLFIKFGIHDQYKDLGSILLLPSDPQAPAADWKVALTPDDALPIPHILYIAVPVSPSWPKIDTLRLRFALEDGGNAAADARTVQFELPTHDDPSRPVPGAAKTANGDAPAPALQNNILLIPQEDATRNLSQSGDVTFLNPPRTAPVVIAGVAGNWFACRLLTPISRSTAPLEKMVRASQLPVIKQVNCEMELARQGLAIEQAFYNAQKLDLTKDFFPFGERPKFGDVLFLGSHEVFSDADAQITLHVELTSTNASPSGAATPNTPIHNTQLSWEFWNGQEWIKLGRSRFLRVGDANPNDAIFVDETKSFSNDGDVKFKFPSPPQESTVNGQKNYWIRVRIAAGNYGEELQFQKDPSVAGLVARPVTPPPPSIKSIRLDYAVKKEASPTAIISYNDFAYTRINAESSFEPFTPVAAEDAPTAVSFGFVIDPPLGAKQPVTVGTTLQCPPKLPPFPNQTVTLYVATGDAAVQSRDHAAGGSVATWQYWNGSLWKKSSVRDETQNFRRSGLLQFLPPVDFETRTEFARERYWLRMRPNRKDFAATLRNLYLNTMTATQGISVVNDILGTSDGTASQKFETTQAMVLPGQKLEVREPTLPPAHECKLIKALEGNNAIQEFIDPAHGAHQYWVTWHEVTNFYGSTARDRHYVFDHAKREVTFGDGVSGLIPPVLPGNIRMTGYRSGGGVLGNKPAQTIAKLNSAVPYIQKVVNWLPANGGTDEEPVPRLLERGSRSIRHRSRAVTFEDFEDLAMLCSRDVARAKCVPLYDLSLKPEARHRKPGMVSLIVLPTSLDPKPIPSCELLDRVRSYIDALRVPTNELVVVGPEYININVDVEIAVDAPSEAHNIDLAIRNALNRYLHPVNGGPNGLGWEFGRLPQKFELNVLIEKISGVNHVRNLRINTAGRTGAEKSGHFLICCGQYRIAMTLEEQRAVEFA